MLSRDLFHVLVDSFLNGDGLNSVTHCGSYLIGSAVRVKQKNMQFRYRKVSLG